MTIENNLNKIGSHLENFDIHENKENLLKICSNLLNKIIDSNKDITEESKIRIDELKEKINKSKASLRKKETDESTPDLKASAEDEEEVNTDDWVLVGEDTNFPEASFTQSTSPSSAPSSMPSSVPSYNSSETSSTQADSPSSAPSSVENTLKLGVSILGASGILSGSVNRDLFLGRNFHDDSDNSGGIC